MDEQTRFEKMVLFLAKLYYENENFQERIYELEDKIEESGLGEAYFGTAKSNYNAIWFDRKHYVDSEDKFYAEYYDGNNAPWLVCRWNADFAKLEHLLKTQDNDLWKLFNLVLQEFPQPLSVV